MLDLNLFRVEKGGNPDIIRESQRRRKGEAGVLLVDEIIKLDTEWRQCQHKVEQELRKEMNQISKKVKQKQLNPEKVTEEREELIKQMKDLKVLEAETNKEAKEKYKTLIEKLKLVGNLVHDSVPVSDDEAQNAADDGAINGQQMEHSTLQLGGREEDCEGCKSCYVAVDERAILRDENAPQDGGESEG